MNKYYYIEENNNIIGADTVKERLENIVKMPQYSNLQIKETDKKIVSFNGRYVFNEEKCKAIFESDFFEIPNIGWYRKVPRGYSSAIESLNTAFNAVEILNSLPADYLIFYTKPDFTQDEQCTEEWLIANQFKNKAMTKEEFMQFYANFVTAWNNLEHLQPETQIN